MRRLLPALVAALAIFAGCGQGNQSAPIVQAESTTTTTSMALATTTSTTAAPVTTTTVCVATVSPAAAQAAIDQLVGGRRQAESAMAQIQYIAEDAGRQIDSAKRYVATKQEAYNDASAAFSALPLDTNRDRMVSAERYLADAKDRVASWESLRAKALGDLSRGKATLADWDRQISRARQAAATPTCA